MDKIRARFLTQFPKRSIAVELKMYEDRFLFVT